MTQSKDKKEMPANGGGVAKGKPDGVSGSPDTGGVGGVHGRSSGGESGGGAYPNPHSGKGPTNAKFSGGQAEKAYYGGDNPNATNPQNSYAKEVRNSEENGAPVEGSPDSDS